MWSFIHAGETRPLTLTAQALRYLEKQYTREAETYMEETEHRALQKRNSVPLLLNLAAVQLKLGDYRAAIVSCDEVH